MRSTTCHRAVVLTVLLVLATAGSVRTSAQDKAESPGTGVRTLYLVRHGAYDYEDERDPAVGKALGLIHGRFNHPWTAEELAAEVALSRSAFNDRFTHLIGVPPKRYLLQWRLKVAQERLRDGALSIAQVAHEVGYVAEEAFNRAFKREFGLPPSAWRKQAQQESGAHH